MADESLFDEEGDSLMVSLNKEMSEKENVLRLIHHPNFVLGTFKVTSKTITGQLTTFTAQPIVVTRNVDQEDTILFRKKSKKASNGSSQAILVKDIYAMHPIAAYEKLFKPNPNENKTVTPQTTSGEVVQAPQPGKFSDSHINTTLPEQIDGFETFCPQRSSTMEKEKCKPQLPMLQNGKVDLFLLVQWHKQEQEERHTKIPFVQWRAEKGFTKLMQQKKLTFASPISFKGLSQREQKVKDWQNSFIEHRLSFDDWHSVSLLQQEPDMFCTCCACGNNSQCMCCRCLELQAREVLSSSKDDDNLEDQSFTVIRSEQSSLNSSDSYICPAQPVPETTVAEPTVDFGRLVYNILEHGKQGLTATEWLASEPDKEAALQICTKWRKMGGWEVLRIPFRQFVQQEWPCYVFSDEKNNRAQEDHDHFITSKKMGLQILTPEEIIQLYDIKGDACSQIINNLDAQSSYFLPSGKLAHIYIPTYNYIPEECLELIGLKGVKLTTATKTLVWQKLFGLRQEAQAALDPADLEDICPSPWSQFLMQNVTTPESPDTSLIDLVQHSQAVKHNYKYQLDEIRVYDTLFRPMERLCGIDMPLHDTLAEARFDMRTRAQLFTEMNRFISFKGTLNIDKHHLFRHLSYIRHLSCENLTPHHKYATGPIMTLAPLYEYESKPGESRMSYEVYESVHSILMDNPSTFSHTFWILPIGEEVAEMFPMAGGRFMSALRMKEIISIQNDLARGHTRKRSSSRYEKDACNSTMYIPEITKQDTMTKSSDSEDDAGIPFAEMLKLNSNQEKKVPTPEKPAMRPGYRFKFMASK